MIATLPLRLLAVLILLVGFTAPPIAAQSPNTATMIVVVTDETGAIVKDAKVSVTNSATGALREAISGSEGSATVPALSLTGTYTVSVPNPAFDTEERKEITLRAGRNGNIYRQASRDDGGLDTVSPLPREKRRRLRGGTRRCQNRALGREPGGKGSADPACQQNLHQVVAVDP